MAAVPSLHAAFSLLVVLALWPTASRRVRIGLALYPLAMGFTLVATAEHYVSDVLLGWAYTAAVAGLWTWIERRRARSAPAVRAEPDEEARAAFVARLVPDPSAHGLHEPPYEREAEAGLRAAAAGRAGQEP